MVSASGPSPEKTNAADKRHLLSHESGDRIEAYKRTRVACVLKLRAARRGSIPGTESTGWLLETAWNPVDPQNQVADMSSGMADEDHHSHFKLLRGSRKWAASLFLLGFGAWTFTLVADETPIPPTPYEETPAGDEAGEANNDWPVGDEGHTASLLDDGTILLVGGDGSNGNPSAQSGAALDQLGRAVHPRSGWWKLDRDHHPPGGQWRDASSHRQNGLRQPRDDPDGLRGRQLHVYLERSGHRRRHRQDSHPQLYGDRQRYGDLQRQRFRHI